jgi:integrase
MRWQHSDWYKLVATALRDANLSRLTAYDLRHTFISEALIGGVDPMMVGRLVGASLQEIMKVYRKLVKDHAIEAFKGVVLL